MTKTQSIEAVLHGVMLGGETAERTDGHEGVITYHIRCANQTTAMVRCWQASDALTRAGIVIASTSVSPRGGWHAIIEIAD